MTDTQPQPTPKIQTNTDETKDETTDSEGTKGLDPSQPVNLQKRKGELEPTRYGDWELNGRCIDF